MTSKRQNTDNPLYLNLANPVAKLSNYNYLPILHQNNTYAKQHIKSDIKDYMKEKVLIIGAGLCGSLLAIKMAQNGYQVELRESRFDLRNQALEGGRSINLALSARGLLALESIGIGSAIKAQCIPMVGRMIHSVEGELRSSRYSGRKDEVINSISRTGLNVALLEKADSFKNLHITFDSRCTKVNLKAGSAVFKNKDGSEDILEADVILGTDGAGSIVRRSMMLKTTDLLFNYSQNFLRSGYKELQIPPAADGSWRIEKNALHIWPRGKFMMIALPNLDGSFTVTMFHPYEGHAGFNTLNTPEKVQTFFEKYYADSLPHMPDLQEDYFDNPVGVLGTNKCYPWQAYGKVCIMGDAAHAIVPFYGQGMNASFEDVRIFDEIHEKHQGNWSKIFTTFQDARVDNTNAIADLAIDNFYEMQDKVDDIPFIKKRTLEMKLEQTYDDYYSKYSLVTFRPELPYYEAMRRGRAQDELLLNLCKKNNIEDLNLDDIYHKIKAIKV